MAQHKSAKKRIRQTESRTAVNKNRLSRVRTFIKNVESAIEEGDKASATAAFKLMEPEVMRGVSKGIFKKKTASRKVSRLSTRVKSIAA